MVYKRTKSFTLLELIIIITIVAILGAIAVARVIDLANEARNVRDEFNINLINSGLKIYYTESHLQKRTPLYPVSLDDVIDGTYSSKDNPFFFNVLRDEGLKSSGWQKINANNYIGPGGKSYTYDNNEGIFYK